MHLKLTAVQAQDGFVRAGRRVKNVPTMVSHPKENVAFFFPINDPVFVMNSYPAEKGKNKKQN